ncbi:MAG: hypothetical protein ABFE01_06060 [Phycisphaerales bacterium]|jgi:hypothetical protein
MTAIADEIRARLKPLVGLRLSSTTRAADVRCFRFGRLPAPGREAVDQYVLHVQCSWRIEGPDGLLTGRSDLWEPAEDPADVDLDAWDFDEDENLQDRMIDVFLRGYDIHTGSFNDEANMLVVEAVLGDAYGGATLTFSGGCRLVIFPAGSRGEDWRIFRPGVDEPHFVIAGGRVETEDE